MVARQGPPRHRGALVESMVCLALEIPQEGKIMRNGRATTRRPVTVVVAVITDSEDFQVPIPSVSSIFQQTRTLVN